MNFEMLTHIVTVIWASTLVIRSKVIIFWFYSIEKSGDSSYVIEILDQKFHMGSKYCYSRSRLTKMRWNSSRRFVINVYDPSIVEDFKQVLLVSIILAETTRLLQANHQLPTLPGHAYEEPTRI